MSTKNPLIPAGIEPATFRFVAQHLNHCATAVPRRCGAEDEILSHVVCECEALASHRHATLDSFFLDPEDVKSLSLGAIWNFRKGTGLVGLDVRLWGYKGSVCRPRWIGTERVLNLITNVI